MNIEKDFSRDTWDNVENAVWDEVTDSINLAMNRIVWIDVEEKVESVIDDFVKRYTLLKLNDYEY